MNNIITSQLGKLFKSHFDSTIKEILPIPSAGSTRKYFRIYGDKKTAIGVWNDNDRENEAYISFTDAFLEIDLAVPKIFAKDLSNSIYIIEDFGDQHLFNMIPKEGYVKLPEQTKSLYKKTLDYLPKFQIGADKVIDYSKCYPRSRFDKQSILWDLNYFKYHFVKLKDLRFDEQLLEDDFNTLTDYILHAPSDFFMYRDFQSRNVIIKDNNPHFIDFQGGRKGPLQYDIISMLYQVKAQIPENDKQELLNYYLQGLKKNGYENIEEFYKYYPEIILLRLMQVLGAYGFRGLHEKRQHFLESIPFAIGSLEETLNRYAFSVDLPELNNIFEQIISINSQEKPKTSNLTVTVNSFSFKKAYPVDYSGNGGGFVFDCRSLPNPGREKKYAELNGKDKEVIDFLENKSEVKDFIKPIKEIIDSAISNYIERDFNHLMISFGCTGGQHRSVYLAEKISEYIKQNHPVIVSINHREQDT
ncbi:phosphotransferase [Bacteroidota bacterium]